MRIEIYQPSSPSSQQQQNGCMAHSTTADGSADIQLCGTNGSRDSLRFQLAQLFVPESAKHVCSQRFLQALKDGAADFQHMSMVLQGQPVSTRLNLWQQAADLGAQPSELLSVQLSNGTVAGNMILIDMPNRTHLQLPKAERATGIIWLLSGSDAVCNLFPEVSCAALHGTVADITTSCCASQCLTASAESVTALTACSRRSQTLPKADGRPLPKIPRDPTFPGLAQAFGGRLRSWQASTSPMHLGLNLQTWQC